MMICTICKTEPVTADPVKYPDTDFCRFCWQSGLVHQRTLTRRGLIERLEQAGATSANVWQTGGGCMVLAIRFADGSIFTASHEDGPSIPDPDGPWGGYISANDEVYAAWDEGQITEHMGIGGDEGLVAFVAEQAHWRNRYRYERFEEPEGSTFPVSWLIFDRKGLGCLAKLGTEREAALITAALNSFALSGDAAAYEQGEWKAAA